MLRAVSQYRYVVREATVEDADGEPVGTITLMRSKPAERARWRWQVGMMNRFPTPIVHAQGFSPTYEEAKAALEGALQDRESIIGAINQAVHN